MNPRKNQANRNSAQIVTSVRLPPDLVERIDWLARNDNETRDRSEGIRKAIENYCQAREAACIKKGLSVPTSKA